MSRGFAALYDVVNRAYVRAEGLLGRVLDATTPAWSRLAAGCRLNRRTSAAISAAAFRIEQADRQALQGGIPLISGAAAQD